MMTKEKKYNEVAKSRQQIMRNKKAMKYYNFLKEINKNDLLYGWEFEDDAILVDTLEDLNIYSDDYIISILNVYKCELIDILSKKKD